MTQQDFDRRRFVFVGGLHRSGTSLIARAIAAHPDVAGIAGAPVPEQEGVYLQGGIPHDAGHGVPGAFAFDDAQHLTEESAFNTFETARRMRCDWAPWFGEGTAYLLEKSPVNLLRTRLYQQLFPAACFVLVTRHPVATARATAKWSDRGEAGLLAHWDAAHVRLLGDLPRLHNWLLVRYEDFTAAPAAALRRIATFLDVVDFAGAPVCADRNADYDAYGPHEGAFPLAAGPFGYASCAPPEPPRLRGRHMLGGIASRL